MCAFGYHGCFPSSWSYNVKLLQHMIGALLVLSGSIVLAADAEHNTTIVPGAKHFVTDDTRELTFTCNTTAPFYIWTLPGPRPCPSSANNTCTFRPRLEDDGRKAYCIVLNSSDVVLYLASYDIDLQLTPPLPTTPSGDGFSAVERVVIAVVFNYAVALVVVIVIVVKRKMKAKKRNACKSTGQTYYDNYAFGSESEPTSQRVTAC
ncbi:uncharacterized protein [Littorina saxatilis]|uniref:uncharacterized protein n=1 Tax=Littorina saxatilis TaxID=31220 RepID=UPI0038B546D2